MARISLVNVELLQQLQRAAGGGAANTLLSRLSPGDVVQAQVIRALGDSLFTLNLHGFEVVTASQVPLTPGQVLTLQLSQQSSQGPPSLRLLTATEGAVAQVSRQLDAGEVNARPVALPEPASRQPAAGTDIARGSAPGASTSSLPAWSMTPAPRSQVLSSTETISPQLQSLLQEEGAVVELLAERPDLVRRLDTILQTVAPRERPVGGQLLSLVGGLQRSLPTRSNDLGTTLTQLLGKLLAYVLPEDALAKPTQLAALLQQRIPQLAGELEARLAAQLLAEDFAEPLLTTSPQSSGTPTAPKATLKDTPATTATLSAATSTTRPAGLPTQAQSSSDGNPVATDGPSQAAAPVPATPTPRLAIGAVIVADDTTSGTAPAPTAGAAQTDSANTAAASQPPGPAPALTLPGRAIQFSTPEMAAPPAPSAAGSSANPVSSSLVDSATTRTRSASAGAGLTGDRSADVPAADRGEFRALGLPALTSSQRGGVTEFDQDLKAQVLKMRTALEQQADTPHRPELQQALQRADQVIDQITAQQLRNVGTLADSFQVAIPVDPRTGLEEAKLQVFYRDSGSSRPPADPEHFTVALFLKMSRLGEVLATVSTVGPALTIGFSVENRTSETALVDQADELRSTLVESGHEAATITVRQSLPQSTSAGLSPTSPVRDEFNGLASRQRAAPGQLDRRI